MPHLFPHREKKLKARTEAALARCQGSLGVGLEGGSKPKGKDFVGEEKWVKAETTRAPSSAPQRLVPAQFTHPGLTDLSEATRGSWNSR